MTTTAATRTATCGEPGVRLTKSLAGYGVLAGPVYVGVSLAQALTRAGFQLDRHPWSVLALGDWGWVQTTNFVATALMTGAGAVALRRTLAGGRAARSVPALVGLFGLGMLGAATFQADPVAGFPAGAAVPTVPTLHGMLHFMTSGVGFLALAAAMVVMALRYATQRRRGRAAFSVVAPVALLGGFGTIASGSPAGVPAFIVGVVTAFAWLSLTCADAYSHAAGTR